MVDGNEREMDDAAPDIDDYRSYLLRCWRETEPTGSVSWRFRLQPVAGGEPWGFRDLRALFEHVAELLSAESEGGVVRGDLVKGLPADKGDPR